MINLKMFYRGVKIFLLQEILPPELFHDLLYSENMQKNSLESVIVDYV
jgi:hypothetical protein